MKRITSDVVVVGAGPAGLCAAVAAARLGASTVLIGNRPTLGGNSSSEVRVWTRGATGAGNLYSEEMGVWGDFKMRNLFTNLEGNPILWDEVLLDLCLQQPGLDIFLNTHITNVDMENGRVASVGGWQLNSEREYVFEGRVFIDCTGDGTVGSKAGVPFRIGKEGKDEYNEPTVAVDPDPTTQGHSILYYVKKTDKKINFIPPAYAYDMDYVEELIGRGGRVVSEKYAGSDYWWFEYGGKGNTIKQSQDITLELKRLVMGVWNYIKNSGKFEAENLTLEWVGNYSGKRESRRMVTDYVLTQNDLLERRGFDDGAFYGGWYMDFHPAGGFTSEAENCEQIPVNLYEIPLRTLYNSTVNNLLFAGRDIGATHAAFASSRIMNTCALSGQAAGTAASIIAQKNIGTDAIDDVLVATIRQTLLREDMFVLRCKNEDPADLARQAKVMVSSVSNGGCGEAVGTMAVKQSSFLVVPSLASVRVLISAKKAATLRGTWYTVAVPSRYCPGREIGALAVDVPEGQTQWVELIVPETDKEGFRILVMEKNEDLVIHTEATQRPGLLCGHKESSDYSFPCVEGKLAPLYSADNLQNGYNRPYRRPNLWRSGEGDQAPTLQLAWDKLQKIGEIRLYLNPDLSMEIPSSHAETWADEHKFTVRQAMPPQLVKHYEVQVMGEDGSWQTVAKQTNNWRRMVVETLPVPVTASTMRIVFHETYGDGPTELFEIRVYPEAQSLRTNI